MSWNVCVCVCVSGYSHKNSHLLLAIILPTHQNVFIWILMIFLWFHSTQLTFHLNAYMQNINKWNIPSQIYNKQLLETSFVHTHTHTQNPIKFEVWFIQGCKSVCEKKSDIIWNAWKDVIFNALKVWKWGFVKSKKVWNQLTIWTLHIPITMGDGACIITGDPQWDGRNFDNESGHGTNKRGGGETGSTCTCNHPPPPHPFGFPYPTFEINS